MEGFQKIVLIVAIIVLIIALIFIGITMSSKKNTSWPPILQDCPDYWNIDGSGNNTTCTNVKDLGTCPPKSGDKQLIMNFNSSVFSGDSGTCNKFKWAKNCNVSWDGITYGVNNPCQS